MTIEDSEKTSETERIKRVYDEWKSTRDEVRVTIRNVRVRFIKQFDHTIIKIYSDSREELITVRIPK